MQEIQKLIDAEKAAFDYARMLLTTIAWWSILIIIISAIRTLGNANLLFYIAGFPILAVGVAFGCYLAFRINLLTERASTILLGKTAQMPIALRWPINAILFLLPLASAWMIVWALFFARWAK
ncbi:hypothetical protein [Starkeya nomas]|uniref:hypothetical protein n=1 Tax=Starkeya nomas TaxID=2666134 RepID=UPI00135C0126|nr:hypothetical protein [Starkeya nomas]